MAITLNLRTGGGTMAELVGIINININPVLIDTGGFELTWHGLFTAVGIALGVWLAVRLARRARISEDDAMSIAVVSVLSGIIGARLLWVFEHTDQIQKVGDIFALTDGGISIYGAMIGGVLGGFIYVTFFKPDFPKWVALDVAAPGMILGQASWPVRRLRQRRALRQRLGATLGIPLHASLHRRSLVGARESTAGSEARADSTAKPRSLSTPSPEATNQSSTS